MSKRAKNIFSQSEHIRERMQTARERLLGAPGTPFSPAFMEPPVDIYETEGEVVIVAEIAGIAENEVELEVRGSTLVFRGERRAGGGGPRRAYSLMEIDHGPFRRELRLPAEVNAEKAEASYKDGMLEIVLPKASPTISRHVKILVR